MIKKLSKLIKNNPRIIIYLLFFITFPVYAYNLSPGIYGGDSGDFASAIITKGVPHPSGYPLYTMLGILFMKIPIVATPAWKIGLLSSFCTSLSVVVVYLISKEQTKNEVLSIITSLIFAFAYPFWLYAVVVEIFSLHILLILLILYFTTKYIKSDNKKYLYLLSITLGLSLTNNQSAILIFPVIAVTLIYYKKSIIFYIKKLPKLLLTFAVGLLPYVYIPISVINNKHYSWGYAVNLKNFLSIVLRKEYGWGINTSGFTSSTFNQTFDNYFIYLKEYVNIAIPVLALFGLIFLLTKRGYLDLVLFGLSFVMLGPFFLIYARSPLYSFFSVSVLERFYLGSILIMLLVAPLGVELILYLFKKLNFHKPLPQLLKLSVMIVYAMIPFYLYFKFYDALDLHDNYIGDNLALDILGSLPNDSIALYSFDTKVFNALYYQNAYGIRNDIYIPGRPNSFTGLLKEAGLNDWATTHYIEKRGGVLDKEMFNESVRKIVKNREVFSDRIVQNMELADEERGKIIFVPHGLVYKLVYENDFRMTKEEYISEMLRVTTSFHTSELTKHDNTILYNANYADIKYQYSTSFYSIADFIATYYSDPKSAIPFLIRSSDFDVFGDL
jgi:hypothetical protein